MKTTATSLAVIALLLAAGQAHAVSDPAGDLLASFAGDRTVAAFDILSAEATFDAEAGTFLLHAHTAGPIADIPTAAYVFGFDRGAATASPFAGIGVPGVTFDAAVLLRSNGTGTVGGTPLVDRVEGNDIFATVPVSLLPSTGFAPEIFTWALWSIDTSITGNTRNADFGPDANLRVAAVPEPQTWAVLLAGLGIVTGVARRRSRARA